MKTLKFLLISTIILSGISSFGQTPCFECDSNTATGEGSAAFGYENYSTGDYSFTVGSGNTASDIFTISLGYESISEGQHAISIGRGCYSKGMSYSIGQNARANASQSLAIGRYVETYASGAIVIGSSSSSMPLTNGVLNSLMIGFNSTVPTLFVSESEYNSNHTGLGNVGIGTSEPASRLQVSEGDIYIEDIDCGIIMKSPDGNCWRGTIDNNGQLAFTLLVECPEDEITDIENQIQKESEIKIYPNPAENYIKVEVLNITNKNLRFDLITDKGSIINSITLKSNLTTINIETLAPGIYYGKVIGEGFYKVEKIIKLK